MYIVVIVLVVLLLGYFGLIYTYSRLWDAVPQFETGILTATKKVSVIIPARNEAHTIERCIESLLNQTYPKHLLEMIVVDDHSGDNTAAIAKRYKEVTLIPLQAHLNGQKINSYKKKAIEVAIAHASGDLVITTDADCISHPNWITSIVSYQLATGKAFIVAPVKIIPGSSLLGMFQSMDFAVLQGITAASVNGRLHNMCNGANLAYKKQVFMDVGGFQGVDHLASGDDMLLMDKVAKRHPESIGYLLAKEAIVSTAPAQGLKAFLQQRIRWASKAPQYKSTKMKLVLLLVLLVNISLVGLCVGSFFNILCFRLFMIAMFYKILIEWRFVSKFFSFYSLDRLLFLYPLFQPLHILYTVIAGLAGMFTKYEWKGRTVQ